MKKEICKNCEHCSPSYKGGVCNRNGKNKKVKYSAAACEHYAEKQSR